MVTASDGSGDLLVVSSEIIIRSAHRSTSSNLGATGTLVQGDSYPSLMRLNAGYAPYGRLAPRLLLLHIPAPPLQLQRQQHTFVLAMEMVGGDANGGIGVGCVVVGGARVTRVQALEPGGDKEATCAPQKDHMCRKRMGCGRWWLSILVCTVTHLRGPQTKLVHPGQRALTSQPHIPIR